MSADRASLLSRLEDCGARGIVSLGIDPGGTTGLMIAGWIPGQRAAHAAWAMQVNADGAVLLLCTILDARRDWHLSCGGMEQFRPGTGRRDPLTRDLSTDLARIAEVNGLVLGQWPAGTLKPWTLQKQNEKRLRAAGLHDATAGKPHALDAARAALYAAVYAGGLPDPLSARLLAPAGERGAHDDPQVP